MTDSIGTVIISIGILFDVFGCIGLLRLPDVYNRLQAATKCVTLGTCLILVGTLLICGSPSVAAKCVICIVFIVITSPTGAHALARGAYISGIKLWDRSVVDMYAEDVNAVSATNGKDEETKI